MKNLVVLTCLIYLFVGCGPAATVEPESASGEIPPTTISMMTHDSFDISEETLAAFTEETGHTVEILRSGDAGEMVNKAILAKGNPLADVIFGIDNTFLSRALENDILVAYDSPALANIPDNLELNSQNRALPVDFGDVCLNYDIEWFETAGLSPPSNLDDLIDPAYEGLTVVQNPATSSPGLAFLMATVDAYGEDGYLDFWASLRDNGVQVTAGWEDAYYGNFTRYGGTAPIVVSYASSPPAEVIFADPPVDSAVTASVIGAKSCFRQIEFVGILEGSEHVKVAQEWVDFMLSETFQADIPLNMYVFPANENAALPAEFVEYAQIPDAPASLDTDLIARERENWIQAWTDIVLP